jgi:peptide/nickel transport system permease protein
MSERPMAAAPSLKTPRRPRLAIPTDVTLALTFLALLVLAALVPARLTAHDPYATDAARAFLAPSWTFPFGTDHAGRDLYARVVYGTRQSLAIGVLATAIGLGGGLLLGLGSALAPAAVDLALGRLIDVLFVFPTLLMALLFIAVLGGGVGPLIVAVGVGSIPDAARLIRAQALQVEQADYVLASRALGRSGGQLLLATVLPNVVRPLFVVATLGAGQAILWASSLSFLGLGAAPPAAEWGEMLADGRDYLQVCWWMSFFPGLFITASVLCMTVVGRHLQQRGAGR